MDAQLSLSLCPPEVAQGFRELRDLPLTSVEERDGVRFRDEAAEYFDRRKRFFARLLSPDVRYLGFQRWQEGMGGYTQVKAAEGRQTGTCSASGVTT